MGPSIGEEKRQRGPLPSAPDHEIFGRILLLSAYNVSCSAVVMQKIHIAIIARNVSATVSATCR